MWLKLFIISFLIISVTAFGPKKIRLEIERKEKESNVKVKALADPFDGIDYRLPNNTLPIHYDIFLSTDIHIPSFAFEGTVTIRLRALENTSSITLHTRFLIIENVDFLDENGNLIQSNVNYQEDSVREFLIIRPQSTLMINEIYHVRVNYLGTLRTDDAGFYRSSYVNSNGVRVYQATTQFESTDARHAFPW